MPKIRPKRRTAGYFAQQAVAVFTAASFFITCHPVLANDIQIDGSTQSRIYNININGAVFNADGTQVTNSAAQNATSASSVVITTGTKAGNNAFNSFSTFNVGTGKSVNLVLPKGTNTLINRVTGPASSTIAGQLESHMFDAAGNRMNGGHVILINPNGVLFGSTAQVNVGALTATSATGIRFSDGIMGVKASQNLNDSPFTGVLQRYVFNLANNQPAAAIRVARGANLVSQGDISLLGGSILAQGNMDAGGNIFLIAADRTNAEGQRVAFEVDMTDLASRLNAGNLSTQVTEAGSLKNIHQHLNSDLMDYSLIVAGDLPEATRMTFSGTKVLLSPNNNVTLGGTANGGITAYSQKGDVLVSSFKGNLRGAHATSGTNPYGENGKNLTLYSANGATKVFHSEMSAHGGDSLLGNATGRGGEGGNLFLGGRTVLIQNAKMKADGGKTQTMASGGRGGSMMVSAVEDVTLPAGGFNSWEFNGGHGQYSSGVGGRVLMTGNNIFADGSGHIINAVGAGQLATGVNSNYQILDFQAAETLRFGRPTDLAPSFQLRTRGYTYTTPQMVQVLDDGNALYLSGNTVELNGVKVDTGGAAAMEGSNQAGGVGGIQRITGQQIITYNSEFYSTGGLTFNTEAKGYANNPARSYGIEIMATDGLTMTNSAVGVYGGWSVIGSAKGGTAHLAGKNITLNSVSLDARGGQGKSVGTLTGHGSDGGTLVIDGYQSLSMNDSVLRASGWGGANGSILPDGTVVAAGNGGNGGAILITPDATASNATTVIQNSTLLAKGEKAGSMGSNTGVEPKDDLAGGGHGGHGGIIQIGNASDSLSGLSGTLTLGADMDKVTIVNVSGGLGGQGGGLYTLSDGSSVTRASAGGRGGNAGSMALYGDTVTLNARTELYADGGNGGKGGDIDLANVPKGKKQNDKPEFYAGAGGAGGNAGSIVIQGNTAIALNAEELMAQTGLSQAELDEILTDALDGKVNLLEALGETYKASVVSASGGHGGKAGTMQQFNVKNKHSSSVNGATGGQGGQGGSISLQSQITLGMQGAMVESADGTVTGSVAIVQANGGQGGLGSEISGDMKKEWLAGTGNGGAGGHAGTISLGTQTGKMDLKGWIVNEGGNGGHGGGITDGDGFNGNHFGSLQIGKGGAGGNGGTIRLRTVSGTMELGGLNPELSGPAHSVITANGGQGGTAKLFEGSAKDAAKKGYAGKGGQGGEIYINNVNQSLPDAFEIQDNQVITARGGNGGNLEQAPLSGTTLTQITRMLQGVNLNSGLNGSQQLFVGGASQNFGLIESTNGDYAGTPDASVQSSMSTVAGQGGDGTQGQGGLIQFEAAAP